MSAFRQSFVAVVKCDGRILREQDGLVTLPFGAEYELLLKNLGPRPALAKIQIDGKSICDGGFIIQPGQDFPIERFVESNTKGNRFKFIQKTQKIVEHRGDQIDDGMIRIEFWYEKPKPITVTTHTYEHHHHHDHYPWIWPRPYRSPWIYYGTNTGGTGDSTSFTTSNASVYCCSVGAPVAANPVDAVTDAVNPEQVVKRAINPEISAEEGITVKGSMSNQKFEHGYIGPLEENSEVIILRLVGTTSKGQPVEQPVTVKAKLKCETCGSENKSASKYCAECGTYL